jgi:hypothetical protein
LVDVKGFEPILSCPYRNIAETILKQCCSSFYVSWDIANCPAVEEVRRNRSAIFGSSFRGFVQQVLSFFEDLALLKSSASDIL